MQVFLEVEPTNHPDVNPYKARIRIENTIVGIGGVGECRQLFDELTNGRFLPEEIADLYNGGQADDN